MISLARELGVRMTACEMSRELMGLKESELVAGLEETGPENGERWPRWIGDTWGWILAQALGERSRRPAWFDRPAVSRLALTSPGLMDTFAELNAGRTYGDSINRWALA